jgi:hypothetical protein
MKTKSQGEPTGFNRKGMQDRGGTVDPRTRRSCKQVFFSKSQWRPTHWKFHSQNLLAPNKTARLTTFQACHRFLSDLDSSFTYRPSRLKVRRASHGLKKEVPPCHRVQTIKGLNSQETLTWNTRQRRKPFAVLSLLARIPDKPDYRQAPIDPFKYTPAWKGPRRTHAKSAPNTSQSPTTERYARTSWTGTLK